MMAGLRLSLGGAEYLVPLRPEGSWILILGPSGAAGPRNLKKFRGLFHLVYFLRTNGY